MPAPAAAIGLGLGVIATIAVGTIIAQEVIENWDDISLRYNEFCRRLEEQHQMSLPRLRRTHAAHAAWHRDRHGSSGAAHDVPPFRDDLASGFTTARAGDAVSDVQMRHHRSTLEEEEERMMQAAMRASLIDCETRRERFETYAAPEYPKSTLLDLHHPAIEAEPDPFEDAAHDEEAMRDDWSETWTMTGSEHSCSDSESK